MYKVKVYYRGNTTQTFYCNTELSALEIYGDDKYYSNHLWEKVELLDGDFDFVITHRFNLKVVRHYIVTCKDTSHIYFDYCEAKDTQLNLQVFFGREAVKLTTVNGGWVK